MYLFDVVGNEYLVYITLRRRSLNISPFTGSYFEVHLKTKTLNLNANSISIQILNENNKTAYII